MSCGPLNGTLTSSVEASILSLYSLGSLYDNEFNIRTPNIDLNFSLTSSYQNGFLTSSLQCSNFTLPFGDGTTNNLPAYSYNLEAELSSSIPLQACIFTEAVYIP